MTTENQNGRIERVFHDELAQEFLEAVRARDEGNDEELALRAEAEALLRDAWRARASDIHIDPDEEGIRIRLRIDGIVLNAVPIDHDHGLRLLNQFKTLAGINPVTLLEPEDGRFSHILDDNQRYDFRLTCAPCINGEKLTIRTLFPKRIQLQTHELGLHDQGLDHLDEWLSAIHGMLLVVGPTGSGKTTTLYALLHRLKFQNYNIMTIEDPVEYEIGGINQIQVNKPQGLDFPNGIRALLRLDPDYILVGEVRSEDSARTAFEAAVSGHAVMTTLHSHDAVSALTVLRNYNLDPREISSNVNLIVAQRLVRKLCTHCREQTKPSNEDKRWLRSIDVDVPNQIWHAPGCERCQYLGFAGRTGVFEIWRINEEDYSLILEGADEHALRDHLAAREHRFMLDDALEKVAQGVTSLSELRPIGSQGALGGLRRNAA